MITVIKGAISFLRQPRNAAAIGAVLVALGRAIAGQEDWINVVLVVVAALSPTRYKAVTQEQPKE